MSNFYICTAIPYVNSEPHVGNSIDLIVADVIARYQRQQGSPVIFQAGTDEHGGKIAEKAKEQDLTPQQFVDKMVKSFEKLLEDLNISADRFVRTTDKQHIKRSQQVWQNLKKDIYKGTYVGWYCTGCEEFYPETTVKANNGVCPLHNRKYEKLEEENYFFALSKYTDQIKHAIESGKYRVVPKTRRNEIMSVINSGLEDISISRPKTKISWGIPVPGDADQVMYVWFEALLNYITVLGYPETHEFQMFWPANVQVIGKDILRFHAAIWPGILLGLGLQLPKLLYVHGHIMLNGKKLSKSQGNYVTPAEILQKYNSDVYRYFFLRHIPSYEDGDFNWDRIEAAYNNELADQLGNAVSRTVAMIQKYQDGLIGDVPAPNHDLAQFQQAIADCRFDRALDEAWEQVKGLNQYIDEEKPWELAKSDPDHLKEVLAYMVGCLLEISDMLHPFMPVTAQEIRAVFGDGFIRPLKGPLFPKANIHPEAAAPASK